MNDRRIEEVVSGILRTGVLLSAVTAITGGVLFLVRHAGDRVDYHTFHSQPDEHRHVLRIVEAAWHGQALPLMQLGILLLIATPIARVAFSLVGFGMERDRTYMVITAIVLSVLLYSLIAGK